MRTIDDVTVDINEAQWERKVLNERITALQKELREIEAADGAERGHPLLGRKVKRQCRTHYFRDFKTQRGVVCIAGAGGSTGRRGANIKPGEAYVKSHSGLTNYRFDAAGENRTEWELDA